MFTRCSATYVYKLIIVQLANVCFVCLVIDGTFALCWLADKLRQINEEHMLQVEEKDFEQKRRNECIN